MTKVARWALSLCVASSVLAIGALNPLVLVAITVVLAGTAAALWGTGRPTSLRTGTTVLVVTGVALILYTALQCVPLPVTLLARLSPHAARVWEHALDPIGARVAMGALSVDRAATLVQVIRGCAYVSALLITARLAQRRSEAMWLERAIVATGVALLLVTVAHAALGLREVYTLYVPKQPDVTIVAPILNTNQLSGYFTLAACVAFASALSPSPIAPRVVLASSVLAFATAIVWLGSRGAVTTCALGLLLSGVLTYRVSRGKGASMGWLPPFVAGVALLSMAVLGTGSSGHLENRDLSKLSLHGRILGAMTPEYPLFGAGRGAFESAYPELRRDLGHLVVTHPENVVVQWITEWGLIVAVPALVAIVWALRAPNLRARAVAVGPWAALVALGIHNLVDYSSENPGVMISLSVCAGLVLAGASERSTLWTSRPRVIMGVAIALTALGVVLAIVGAPHDLVERRVALQKDSVDPRVSNDAFFAELQEEMRWHPAEPYFPYLGAARTMLFVPNGNVVPWIDRTLERAPVYPPAHLLLARWLRTRNPNQALLEYRLGAEQNGGEVGAEAESLVRSFEDALEVTPDGKAGVEVLEAIASHVALRLPATRRRIDDEILARDPSAAQPRLRVARDAYGDFVAQEPWCEGACAAQAIAAAKEAEARSDVSEPHAFEARVRVANGEKGALETLSAACDRVSDRTACLRALIELAIESKDDARATDAIQKLSDASCTDESDCIGNISAAAGYEERRGHRAQALLLFKRAAEQAPERDDLQELVAAHAKGSGLHAFAADAYGKLAMRHPDNEAYATLAKEERALAAHAER